MNLPQDFIALSQKIGADPLLVQGPGGNTSIKLDGRMWIKASGTKLAEALNTNVFVAVDPAKALLELDGDGDGSCRSALIDSQSSLRPSIETTFHAMFNKKFVFHFHSVGVICHAISHEGREAMTEKMAGLSWVSAPYRKPGVPLTKAIRKAVGDREVQVVVLENHGVIILDDEIGKTEALIDDVEMRLSLPELTQANGEDGEAKYTGWEEVPEVSALAKNSTMYKRAVSGSYYPDHVVFLGPALPSMTSSQLKKLDPIDFPAPVVLVAAEGVYIKSNATPAQRAMLNCVYHVLSRIPDHWTLAPIGEKAEIELLNWDAEKYRQALAKRGI